MPDGLRFFQHQIKYPASAKVRPRTSAVGQNLLIETTGVHEGIRQEWEAVVASVFVNGRDQPHDIGRSPFGREWNVAEGEGTENLSQKIRLNHSTGYFISATRPSISSFVRFSVTASSSESLRCGYHRPSGKPAW